MKGQCGTTKGLAHWRDTFQLRQALMCSPSKPRGSQAATPGVTSGSQRQWLKRICRSPNKGRVENVGARCLADNNQDSCLFLEEEEE